MTFIFFNLLVNSILSLAIGLLIVFASIWFFRIEAGRWKLFLLSLPFVKIVYDFARGVPEKSVLFSGIDPFTLPPMHQIFSIGAGISGWTPYISGIFMVQDLDGQNYPSSVGDYLVIWVHRNLGSVTPTILVSVVAFISFCLFAIRLFQYLKFEKRRQADRKISSLVEAVRLGRRQVDIYESSQFSGTPFTGGVLKPYICLPSDAVAKLSANELQAVIAHEMGHIRYHDLLVTILIQSLGDVFLVCSRLSLAKPKN